MQTFHFDLSTKNIVPVLNVKQGDVGRKFRAVITEEGVAYNIPAGAQFSVWFSGPSGEGNYSAIGDRSAFSVDGNSVTVELIAQMLVNAGSGTMCLILAADDGTQLGLWNVIYGVEHVPGMGSKAAEDYYTALSELARQAIDAAETFETDPSLTVAGKAADAAVVGAELLRKAPAGYGLGSAVREEPNKNVDELSETGWYYAGVGLPYGWGFSIIEHRDCGSYATQTAYSLGTVSYWDGLVIQRTKYQGVWQPWEWVNPPMEEAVEYRTTERWYNRPVYKITINCGVGPNKTITETSIPVENFYTAIACSIHSTHGLVLPVMGFDVNNDFTCGGVVGQTVRISSTTDVSSYTYYATIKYLKTTD